MATFLQPQVYSKIGTIQKLKGLKGAMIINLIYSSLEIPASTAVYVYLHQTYVPYKVVSWQETGLHALLSFATVDTRTGAEDLQGESLFVDKAIMHSFFRDAYWGFVGYEVWDMKAGDMGKIIRVEPRELQPLLVIAYQEKELLVPFHEHFIKSLNHEEQQVVLALPEGYIV